MDLSQLYGPGFAGYLHGKDSVRQRDIQGLQGLGMLSNMQRQQEQIKIAQLSAQKQARMQDLQAQVLQGLMGGGASPAAQAALTQGAAQGDVGPTTTNAQRMGMLNANGGSYPFDPRQIGMMALAGLPGANTLMKGYELTQPQIEFQGGIAFDKRRTPAGTVIPQTNQQGFSTTTVPDGQGGYRVVVTPGAVEAYGAQQRVAQESEGYNPIKQRQQDREDAEARRRGVEIPTRAPLATVGPGNAAVVFPSDGRTQPGQLTPEQILLQERANAVRNGDLNAQAQIDRELANLRGGPAPQSRQSAPQTQGGIKVTPEQRDKLELERPQATAAYRTTTANLDQLESAVARLIQDPGLKGITGMQSAFPNLYGGQAAGAQALLDEIKSKLALNSIQAMRDASKTGGAVGQVTEKEWPRLESAFKNLDTRQSYARVQAALNDILSIVQQSKARVAEQYNMTYPNQKVQILPAAGSATRPSAPGVIDFSQLGGANGR